MRLIDADALKESLTETLHRCDGWIENAKDEETRTIAEANYTAFLESILRVKNAPTIDAVPVIRCKDCKWFNRFGCAVEIVDFTDRPTENDYCSFAYRKRRKERR